MALKTAPKVLKLEVTERDIRLGKPESCSKCPMARAAKRAGLTGVRVDMATRFGPGGELIYFGQVFGFFRGGTGHYYGSKRVGEFIVRFDNGKKVKPGVYTLRRY